MKRFIEGADRTQAALFPERLDDYVEDDNPVRAIDAFVDMLDLAALGFSGAVPEATGWPGYHPGTLLKIYLYGYLNQIQSSRRPERECGRNVELIWLSGRLKPDFKTIADFRKDNGSAIRKVCGRPCHHVSTYAARKWTTSPCFTLQQSRHSTYSSLQFGTGAMFCARSVGVER